MKTTAVIIISFFTCNAAFCQNVVDTNDCFDETEIYNDKANYLKVQSDNDLFKLRKSTDRYFTNGFRLDYMGASKRNWIEKPFFRLRKSITRNRNWGIVAGANMYTPKNIEDSFIQRGDRPYAGHAYIGQKLVTSDFAKRQKMTTEYTFGTIGPRAQQKWLQTKVHEIVKSPIPHGWRNQVNNEYVLNIMVNYEQTVLHPTANLEAIGNLEINTGTLVNYLGAGLNVRLGSFNDYYLNEMGFNAGDRKIDRYTSKPKCIKRNYFNENLKRKCQVYFVARPQFRVVIDNSLLEGGLLNNDRNIYTIPSDKINRLYINSDFGVVVAYRGIFVQFSQIFRSPEFKGAEITHWGQALLAFKLGR